MNRLQGILQTITNVFTHPNTTNTNTTTTSMSESESDNDEESKIILILDNDPSNGKWNCPLTTCSHQCASASTVMQHMWKFKRKNAPNKTCTGQNSPSLTLYPKLFYDTKFEDNTHPTFKQEYPQYKWEIIQSYINPPGDSPPNIIALIQEFDVFITREFLDNYPDIKIPKNLKQLSFRSFVVNILYMFCDFASNHRFILDANFEPDDLPSLLQSIKRPSPSRDRSSSQEPARKKRKTSSTESMNIDHDEQSQTDTAHTLLLPSLNISPKASSHENSMMEHISTNTSLSFDLNNYDQSQGQNHNNKNHNNLSVMIPDDNSSNPFQEAVAKNNNTKQANARKRKRRRCVGPICGGCNNEINPCCAMIKCTECITTEDDDDENGSIGCFKDVIICIECFKNGKEFGSHKRFHRYNVLRPLMDFKLQETKGVNEDNATNKFQTQANKNRIQKHNRWNGNDEWNLLHGIRKYGLGNWSGITKIINKQSFKSKNEQHFDYKHVESHFDYKYGHIVGKPKEDLDDKSEHKENKKVASSSKSSSVSMSTNNTTTTTTRKSKKRKNGHNDNGHGTRQRESKFTDKHKLKCGYKEKRDEFEAEWNNDAEAMIGEMYFSEWDTKDERALKLEGLRLYNNVLQERKIRKKFIKDYGVIYQKKNRRNISEEELKIEEEITNNLSLFARYTEDKNHNFGEFKQLVQGLMEEKRLRERIYKLRHYLLNGVTSLSKMEKIDKYVARQQELKQERDERIRLKRLERQERRKSLRAATHSQRLRTRDIPSMAEDDEDDDLDEDEDYDDNGIIPETADEYLNRYNGCSLDSISTYLSLVEAEEGNKLKAKTRGRRKNESLMNKDKDEKEDKSQDDEDIKGWNLKKLKGVDKLDDGEKKLCDILKVKPDDYQYIRQQIAKRVYLHGLMAKGKVPQQLYINIDDIKNVKESMSMRMGLVDPQLLTNDI